MPGTNMDDMDDGSFDSTSLWLFIEEYYASDEEVNAVSILPLPGIPMYPK
ncbi:UNVERIFIED_CONTAM: hypothetical protein Slati_2251300 [Sesamum latifolium]|uniref:Uncharacterized protein n=1 Tax=Sesamum latifolium TaxID=2727402 RepID=A0AAW2WZA0_9LAMI